MCIIFESKRPLTVKNFAAAEKHVNEFYRVRELLVPLGAKYGHAPTDLANLCMGYNLCYDTGDEKIVKIIEAACVLCAGCGISVADVLYESIARRSKKRDSRQNKWQLK